MTKPTVTAEELTLSFMYQVEALINVLEKKDIVTKEEIYAELAELKQCEAERKKKVGN